jgi:MprA protease rhombosortase-interaction domain-containing protein
MRLSVVVCTRNRSSKLLCALASLERCTRPDGVDVEVLVVDNGSSDDTREVSESFAARSALNCRYVLEATPGKSAALNTGISESAGDHVAFTDDDVIVSTDWLRQLVLEYLAEPEIAGVGGRVVLHDRRDAPVTLRCSTERRRLTVADFSIENIPILGCNMSFRKEVLDEIGLFDERLGPGTPTRSAEEADLLYRVFRRGHVLLYAPEVLVYHDHGRRTDDDLAPLYRDYLRGRGAFYCKWITRGDRATARSAYYELRRFLRSIPGSRGDGRSAISPWSALRLLFSGAAAYAVHGPVRPASVKRSDQRT